MIDENEPTDFSAEMISNIIKAGTGRIGASKPPWVLLAEYVAKIERRLAELEEKDAIRQAKIPPDG